MSTAYQSERLSTDGLSQGMRLATIGNANPLNAIERDLRAVIFGQERAIDSIIRALNRAQFGFAAGTRNRPLINLLLWIVLLLST